MRRFRSKLAIVGAALSLGATLASFLAGLELERLSNVRQERRVDVIEKVEHAFASATAAAEEGFGYVVGGDATERAVALSRYGQLETDVKEIAALSDLDPEERAEVREALRASGSNREAALAMFDRYETTRAVPRDAYANYESAVNDAEEHLARLRGLAVSHLERERVELRRSETILSLWTGLLDLLVSIAFAWWIAGRMTGPLRSLRDAVLAFGRGPHDVTTLQGGDDEVGELARAFSQMARTIRDQIGDVRVARERLEDIFASIDDALIVCTQDGRIARVNAACRRWCGADDETILGMPVSTLIEGERPIVPGTDASELDATFLGRSEGIPVRLAISALRGSAGGYVYVAHDLRPRVELEGRLREAEKLDALGRLAGGISHDFNNMLSVILGYTNVLLEERDPSDDAFDSLMEIRAAGERSADLTRQLLAFSRRQPTKTQVVDVNEAVLRTAKMAGRIVGEHIEVQVSVSARACSARLAPGQIEQVLMNLIVNARDAMPDGGTLVLSTAWRADGATAGRVLVTVRDTGTGMDAATRAHVFEPFFTTKEQGKGTGLGLSTVFGVVRQCGGTIDVESETGRGTAFVVSLPASMEVARQPRALRRAGVEAVGGTVLVVEDEHAVRALTCMVLKKEGYEVLVAERPEDALEICRKRAEPIDVLLTDVVMPRLSGAHVATEVRAMRPDIAVLFMSGYTGDILSARGVDDLGAAFLQKPLSPDDLRKAVHAALVGKVRHSSLAAE